MEEARTLTIFLPILVARRAHFVGNKNKNSKSENSHTVKSYIFSHKSVWKICLKITYAPPSLYNHICYIGNRGCHAPPYDSRARVLADWWSRALFHFSRDFKYIKLNLRIHACYEYLKYAIAQIGSIYI